MFGVEWVPIVTGVAKLTKRGPSLIHSQVLKYLVQGPEKEVSILLIVLRSALLILVLEPTPCRIPSSLVLSLATYSERSTLILNTTQWLELV